MTDAPPPPYQETPPAGHSGPSSTNQTAQAGVSQPPFRHEARNGIPPQSRRSMEDEARPLPPGWVRQYDTKSHHQFFVDTTKDPPRSIWTHPYDDETYLNSLSPQERARIHGLHRVPSEADIAAESSEDEQHGSGLPQREEHIGGVHRFGRKMKDKLTNSTHQEREQLRQQRAREEAEAYRRHQMLRQAMAKAMETGEPQLVGKDRDGKDVYIESPYGSGSGYGQGGYGYNPFQSGVYATPNARYLRPSAPYSRGYGPYGYGYGGGLGLAPLGLGLGGGLMLGGLMGGF